MSDLKLSDFTISREERTTLFGTAFSSRGYRYFSRSIRLNFSSSLRCASCVVINSGGVAHASDFVQGGRSDDWGLSEVGVVDPSLPFELMGFTFARLLSLLLADLVSVMVPQCRAKNLRARWLDVGLLCSLC